MVKAHRPMRTEVVPEICVDGAATLLHGPEDMFWGDRYARLVDPYGHHWSLATPGPDPDLEATAVAEA